MLQHARGLGPSFDKGLRKNMHFQVTVQGMSILGQFCRSEIFLTISAQLKVGLENFLADMRVNVINKPIEDAFISQVLIFLIMCHSIH